MSSGISVDHFVVVMLENRSFDNLLGFLYADQKNVSPAGQEFEGLAGTESNPDKSGNPIQVFKIPQNQKLSYFYPRAVPGEGFANTNVQLYSTNPVPAGVVATNQDFVKNFQTNLALPKANALPGTQASDVKPFFRPISADHFEGACRKR